MKKPNAYRSGGPRDDASNPPPACSTSSSSSDPAGPPTFSYRHSFRNCAGDKCIIYARPAPLGPFCVLTVEVDSGTRGRSDMTLIPEAAIPALAAALSDYRAPERFS